jgi:hypothetical protein
VIGLKNRRQAWLHAFARGILQRKGRRTETYRLLTNTLHKGSIAQTHFFGGVNNSSGLPLSEAAGSFSRASFVRRSFQLENKNEPSVLAPEAMDAADSFVARPFDADCLARLPDA